MSTITHATSHDASVDQAALEETPELVGMLAEFHTVDEVMEAARRTRQAGFTRWDVHSPFPIHGIDYAMGIRPTILPWLVLVAGLTGMTTGILLTWYTNAFDYQYFISGKPVWSFPANIPVIFELTIMFAAYTAVFGMLGLNRLPTLYNPLFKIPRFRRATSDRFFVYIDSSDPRFDETRTTDFLNRLGAHAVERVED